MNLKNRKLQKNSLFCIILHGIEGYPGIHWQKWLSDSLSMHNIKTLLLKLPNPGKPDRKEWLACLNEAARLIDPEKLILIGHSLGVVTCLDFLQSLEEGKKIKALFSISGFHENYGHPLNEYFLKERSIDLSDTRKKCKNIHVIFGSNDPYVPWETLMKLASELKVKPTVIKNGGHINSESGFLKFEKLQKDILKLL